ncbi:MAG TPA: DMT family transporter [Candidatus Pseudomonas excrementavium]|uniref:DMT family transporter n=1 Tax=Halopseudomonas bauzanensis TaxID=653930 RepID=UPI001C3A20A3|nr:DMT family transporter [Halopseudomonas bauzanensis]HIZ50914.1 DMT family transporter [Candidatus Pseudomonas excrementavium]
MNSSRTSAHLPRSQPVPFAGVSTLVWLGVMVLLWGLSWPATKLALDSVPPLWLAAIRFGSAALCLFILLAVRGSLVLPPRADWPIILSIGLLQMMVFTGLGMIAMTHVDTSRAVLLAYTTPLWGVIAGWLLFRDTPTRWQLLALAMGLGGIGLICSPWEMDWSAPGVVMGSVFLIIAAISWSLVILHIRRHRWTASPLSLAPWQMLLATVPLALFASLLEGSPTAIAFDWKLLELLFFIGPVATSACFVISAEHGRRISTFAMSNFTLGVPLIGILASVLLLDNRLSLLFVLGLCLIVCGMVLAAAAAANAGRSARRGTTVQA